MDRYNHDMGEEDTDDTDDFPLIGSFGSYSPQYRKHNSSLVQINLPPQSLDESINTSSGSGTASPISSNLNQSANPPQITANPNIGKIMSTPQLRKLDVSQVVKSYHVVKMVLNLRFSFSFFYQQQVCRTAAMKLPSTPDTDYIPSFENDGAIHQYFKQQQSQHRPPPQHPSVIAVAADIPKDGRKLDSPCKSNANNNKLKVVTKPGKSDTLNVSTPDSSQTDSDDVSPQIQRKRKNTHQRDMLPRFSISIEDEFSG